MLSEIVESFLYSKTMKFVREEAHGKMVRLTAMKADHGSRKVIQ
jgi:hypothetical protein